MPDDIGISVSYPLPGTKFYERVKSELGQKQNWVDSDDLAMLYHGPFSQEFYRTLYRAVHFEFGMRQAWREVKHDLSHPSHWRPRHGRLLASIPWRWLKWQIAQAQWSQMAHTAPV